MLDTDLFIQLKKYSLKKITSWTAYFSNLVQLVAPTVVILEEVLLWKAL